MPAIDTGQIIPVRSLAESFQAVDVNAVAFGAIRVGFGRCAPHRAATIRVSAAGNPEAAYGCNPAVRDGQGPLLARSFRPLASGTLQFVSGQVVFNLDGNIRAMRDGLREQCRSPLFIGRPDRHASIETRLTQSPPRERFTGPSKGH